MGLDTLIAALVILNTILLAIFEVRSRRQLSQLSVNVDQSVQRLHRARDLVNTIHRSQMYLTFYIGSGPKKGTLEVVEAYRIAAEASSCESELVGIARVIGDKEFLALVESRAASLSPLPDPKSPAIAEMTGVYQKAATKQTEQLHEKIYQLLEKVVSKRNVWW
jgi:hypothetical protein